MRGLLDFLQSEDAQLGLALLAAGGPQARPMSFGQRVAGALGAVQEQKNAAAEREMQRQYRQMQMEVLGAQKEETLAQAAERKATIAERDRQRQLLQSIPSLYRQSVTQGEVATPEVDGLPMFSQGSKVTTPSMQGPVEFDRMAALRLGMKPKDVEEYANLTNLGRPEVARTIETMVNGKPVTLQLDKFGQPIGQGMEQWKQPMTVNQGDRTSFVNPVTLQNLGGMPINMSPADQDASRRGWAGHNLAQQKFAWEKTKEKTPTFNADAGGFIVPPSATNPQGSVIPLPGFNKPLTDAQSKALLFGSRAQQSDKLLGGLSAEGVDRPGDIKAIAQSTPLIGNALGAMTNWTQSDGQQQVEQAQRDFINAVLRRESGAVISPEEFDNARKQYFPQIGDSDKVRKQKADNREMAIKGILAEVPGGKAIKPSVNVSNIPKAAVNELKMRGPSAKAQFDQVFGEGAADAVLGGK